MPALGHRERPSLRLGVVYREVELYRIRKRYRPANFAAIRHMTMNLLQRTKTAKKKSVRIKRGLAAPDETFLQPVPSPNGPDGSLMRSSDSLGLERA